MARILGNYYRMNDCYDVANNYKQQKINRLKAYTGQEKEDNIPFTDLSINDPDYFFVAYGKIQCQYTQENKNK